MKLGNKYDWMLGKCLFKNDFILEFLRGDGTKKRNRGKYMGKRDKFLHILSAVINIKGCRFE